MAKLVGHGLASISQDLTAVDDSQRNELGSVFQDKAGGEYIYLGGVGSVVAGDWVMYNVSTATDAFLTVRMVATPIAGHAAVALGATVLGKFGWFQIRGKVLVANIASDASADGKTLSQSGTAGRAATGAVTTKNLFNTVCVGAAASNLGACFICYPFCMASATI